MRLGKAAVEDHLLVAQRALHRQQARAVRLAHPAARPRCPQKPHVHGHVLPAILPAMSNGGPRITRPEPEHFGLDRRTGALPPNARMRERSLVLGRPMTPPQLEARRVAQVVDARCQQADGDGRQAHLESRGHQRSVEEAELRQQQLGRTGPLATSLRRRRLGAWALAVGFRRAELERSRQWFQDEARPGGRPPVPLVDMHHQPQKQLGRRLFGGVGKSLPGSAAHGPGRARGVAGASRGEAGWCHGMPDGIAACGRGRAAGGRRRLPPPAARRRLGRYAFRTAHRQPPRHTVPSRRLADCCASGRRRSASAAAAQAERWGWVRQR
eukprot:scaffold9726_cov119-Isochrysis_galbana.AAC.38